MLLNDSFVTANSPHGTPDTENVIQPVFIMLTDPIGRPNTED